MFATGAAARSTSHLKHWLKPDAYPVIFFAGVGAVFATWFSYRTCFKHNDLTFNKKYPYQFATEEQVKMLDRQKNLSRGVNAPRN